MARCLGLLATYCQSYARNMSHVRALKRCLPYGLVLSSALMSSCVLRIRAQDDQALAEASAQSTASSQESSSKGSQATSTHPGGSEPGCLTPTSSTSAQADSSTSSSSDQSSTQVDPFVELDQKVDRYVRNFLAEDEFERMRGEVRLTHRTQLVSERSYGELPGQRYPFGSITKTMTAVAVLQLEQAGQLQRSDKLRKHVPELPESFDAVTIEQLLTHRSGLADYLDDEGMLELISKEQSQEEMIARISQESPSFTPGTKMSYSNSGYYLLGIIIERASKQSLSEYFRRHIFEPANMEDTNLWDDNIAAGHVPMQGKLLLTPRLHPSISFSAGAAAGTARDLDRFGRALLDGTLLPKPMVEKMMQPQGSVGGLSYGMGLLVSPIADGRRIIGHNGKTLGHRSAWFIISDGEWSSVALSNMAVVNTDQITSDTLKIARTGQYVEPPIAKKALPFRPELAKDMAGNYELDPAQLPELEKTFPADFLDAIRTLTWRGDAQYLVKPAGQGEFEVKLVAKEEFFNQASQITIKVQRSKEKVKVKGVTLIQGTLVLKYLKKSE